ncbi:hypothetical protein [Curtobacterium ammoniigenes]|uniref:hypothetical protein n=1 Tax=Curtobacterium ammoniigenes TaxID=395387 RepID=UPI0008314F7F|nr:hypothetical protein [Curtobacterium ammoniigenes]
MNKHTLSLVIAIVAAVVVLAGAWFVGVQPALSATAANDLQRASIQSTNAQNQAALVQLEQDYKQLPQSQAALAALEQSIPTTASTDLFTREINTVNAAAGTTISSITYGTVQAYAPPAGASGGSSSSAASGTSATPAPTASASASASAAPAAPATPAAAAPYTNPSITAANFNLISVTIAFDAPSYDKGVAFVKAIQSGQRLFLIDTLSQTTGSGSSSSAGAQSWSLSGYIYVIDTTSVTGASTTAATGGSSVPAATATAAAHG